MKIDYFGVNCTCNDKQLKTAFRKLAMQYHPDRNLGNRD
ncbi:DnaJ domain-containing protein, partial [Bartonella massiliensis]